MTAPGPRPLDRRVLLVGGSAALALLGACAADPAAGPGTDDAGAESERRVDDGHPHAHDVTVEDGRPSGGT